MDRKLYEAFRFFKEHAGYSTPPGRAACALTLARAEIRGRETGLTVQWEDDPLPWDGDCEAPPVLASAMIWHPDATPTDDPRAKYNMCDGDPGRPGWVPCGKNTFRRRDVLASLGNIGLMSWSDPYMRVVEAELLAEALGELDAERDRAASAEAAELSSRATFAAGAPA